MISITNKEFSTLAQYIKHHYGIQLKVEKKSLLTGRLQQVLQQLNYDNFTDYFQYVQSEPSGEAMKTLINRVSTNHTFFMREPVHFDYFRNTILPYLSNSVRDRDLRIWSAGCSSGEEPYTLAMIINEFFGSKRDQWDAKILATDISEQMIHTAQAGIYDAERITPLPRLWKLHYFQTHQFNQYAIIPSLKQEVIFRRFNLMDEVFPFKRKFHVIFCRNVMIYFDAQTRLNLIRKFYELTEPGGYLFIGHSESIVRDTTGYRYVMPAVYRKD